MKIKASRAAGWTTLGYTILNSDPLKAVTYYLPATRGSLLPVLLLERFNENNWKTILSSVSIFSIQMDNILTLLVGHISGLMILGVFFCFVFRSVQFFFGHVGNFVFYSMCRTMIFFSASLFHLCTRLVKLGGGDNGYELWLMYNIQ